MQTWELELKQRRNQEINTIEKSFYTQEEFQLAKDSIRKAQNLGIIEKAFEDGKVSEDILEKARSSAGVYADTPENRKKGIVGMKYHGGKVGEKKEEGKSKYGLSLDYLKKQSQESLVNLVKKHTKSNDVNLHKMSPQALINKLMD